MPVEVKRPRLRLILAVVNIVILLLPLAGLGGLRLYDSALIRQTESELIAQTAFVSALYRDELKRLLGMKESRSAYGVAAPSGEGESTDSSAVAPEARSPRSGPLVHLAVSARRPPRACPRRVRGGGRRASRAHHP